MMKRAVIITNVGFEEPEVISPYYRLKEAGFNVSVATIHGIDVNGQYGYMLSSMIKPEVPLDTLNLNVDDFDLVVVPGGLLAPDKLRQDKPTLKFLKEMNDKNKIIASICHGPWILISAGILNGRKVTCYPSMIDDIKNCGAIYEDASVVIDDNIITARRPSDLSYFNSKIIEVFEKLNNK
ncbi:MAG: type 1 glutamine amidotransferase domain-containing protein [bacterium]|nr:type 1 glutamine amidotransferase domain-containing protein [bacterium]